MLALHKSAALSRELSATGDSDDVPADAEPWFGHCVTIQRRKCGVLMDASSRHGLLFAGLRRQDFAAPG